MTQLPFISIVVPSFNQAPYIRETLQSLVDQEYPKLQVIIQDGCSTDGSALIAEDFVRRFPDVFELYVEKDAGQADAINRGFARAKGDILAFLNSDDTYFPRVLHRVASEIDPAHHRHVVMGRCLFTGEGSRYVGVEHPAEYYGHFEHLAIWKRGFNTIPQPSVFWHRKVWEQCGPLDVNEHHALDYDLFCRFSRYHRFHRIDELWSTYRMHDSSKSSQRTEAEVLELSIRVSRKHWGSWLTPLRWRCELSYWLYERHAHERACHHARRAEQAFRERRIAVALIEFLQTLRHSPIMARDRLISGWLAKVKVRVLEKLLHEPGGFTGRYPDSWIGPAYREQIGVPEDGKYLVMSLAHHPQANHTHIRVDLLVDGVSVATKQLSDACQFSLEADLASCQGRIISVEVRCDSFFVPSHLSNTTDDRQLSLMLTETRIDIL
jgi:glycosyltransferase involved in cell wall biosynthesis